MGRELLFSVTIKDCDVTTFRAGGPGGQNQNKRDTGVRILHPPSGALGESREERTQLANKKRAFRRMTDHPRFQTWLYVVTHDMKPIEQRVNDAMAEENLRIEVRKDGQWAE